MEQDECVKIRPRGQERGNFNPNFGLYKNEKHKIDFHEISLRLIRLMKEQAGSSYAYRTLIHEIAEAGHVAREAQGTAQAGVLSDLGVTSLSPDTNLYLEEGSINQINRQGGFNRGSSPVHVKGIKKTKLIP